MNISFYNFTGDKKEADKSSKIILLSTVSATIVGDFNLIDPVIKVETSSDALSCNYVYISSLNKYYFVLDRQGLTAHHVNLVLHEDLRYNFIHSIKASDVTATRSNFYNKNIPDNLALRIPQQRIQYRKLSEALTGQTYIVIIGG